MGFKDKLKAKLAEVKEKAKQYIDTSLDERREEKQKWKAKGGSESFVMTGGYVRRGVQANVKEETSIKTYAKKEAITERIEPEVKRFDPKTGEKLIQPSKELEDKWALEAEKKKASVWEDMHEVKDIYEPKAAPVVWDEKPTIKEKPAIRIPEKSQDTTEEDFMDEDFDSMWESVSKETVAPKIAEIPSLERPIQKPETVEVSPKEEADYSSIWQSASEEKQEEPKETTYPALEQLRELVVRGVLTEEEFQAKKKELLDSM